MQTSLVLKIRYFRIKDLLTMPPIAIAETSYPLKQNYVTYPSVDVCYIYPIQPYWI